MGETGELITQLIGELKGFDATAENQKGFLGFFKKKSNELEALKVKYDKADVNVERIKAQLEDHQVTLMKDIAMLDKMYQLNLVYFKELSMYILAGRKSCSRCGRTTWPPLKPRPKHPACRKMPRPPATWPTSATALKRSCMTWS